MPHNMSPATQALVTLAADEGIPTVATQYLLEISDALDEADTKRERDRQEALELAKAKVVQLGTLLRAPTVRQG